MDIAAVATSLKQHELELEVGTRLAKTAKDAMEAEGAALLELLDSVKMMELSVNPNLGSLLDVKA